MKKIFLALLIIILIVALFVLLSKENSPETVNTANYSFVRTLSAENGTFLGNVYVRYIANEIFSELYILREDNNVIYKINNDGFFRIGAVSDIPFKKEDFYGYRFIESDKNDRILVQYLQDGGRRVTDHVTIYWNNEKRMFEIFKPPF